MGTRYGTKTEVQVFAYNGCPIHYRLAGPEEAPLVVLTHGGMVDHRIWEPQIPVLSAEHRVLVWDVRGHGRSRPGGKDRSIPYVAEDLAALLDHLGYEEANLVGLSAGGWLVQEFAYRYPARANALVMVGTSDWLRPPLPARLMVSRWSPIFPLMVLLLPWSLLIKTLMRMGASSAEPDTRDYLRQVFNEWSKGEYLRHVWYGRGGLRNASNYRFEKPLLIVHGEHEVGFNRKSLAAWADREPQCRYEVIPGAGHVVNMDDPEAFNELVLEFLSEVHTEVT